VIPGARLLVLALGLLGSAANAALQTHDTLIAGVPWLSVENSGPKGASMRIDRDRGVARSRVAPAKGANWTFWDRNPFVREGKGTSSLVIAPRISGSTLLLPRDSRPGTLLARPQNTPSAPAAASPSPASATTPVSDSSEDASPSPPLPAAPALEPPVHATPSAAATPPEPAPASTSTTKDADILGDDGVFTVVIDAGHGGKDPGAIGQKVGGKSVQEKDATLAIALKLRDELKGMKGIRVVMTRDTDVFLTLGERTRLANAGKGDLFVSLHCNSLPLDSKRRDEVDGFMVYLLREAKSEADRAIERRENEAIRFETGERQRKEALSPVEWMMLEHQLNQFTKESERLAGLLVRNLEVHGPVKKERTGAGQAGFFVLVGALMPSVLVEMGFVSHSQDAVQLGTDAGRKAIARQIARSIDEFRHRAR